MATECSRISTAQDLLKYTVAFKDHPSVKENENLRIVLEEASMLSHLPGSTLLSVKNQYLLQLFQKLEAGEGVLKRVQEAAERGIPEAEYTLGMMYAGGDNAPQSDAKACEWLQKASDNNYAPALHQLAVRYLRGRGVEKSLEKSFELAQRAAEQKLPEAEYSLALKYHQGKGVKQSSKDALGWLERAASSGNPIAQYELGIAHLFGKGVSKFHKWAFEWISKSAEQGCRDAQYVLGLMYLGGIGVPEKSTQNALKWLQKAAEDHDDRAQKMVWTLIKGDYVSEQEVLEMLQKLETSFFKN